MSASSQPTAPWGHARTVTVADLTFDVATAGPGDGAPVMLLQGLTTGFMGPGPAVAVVNLLAGGAFLVFWISGLRALSQQRQPA